MNGRVAAAELVAGLRSLGIRRVTGVPCGHLAGPWALFDASGDLIPATSEGAAMALAAGWELAGEPAAVLCQNSGFGNLVNPLTSLLLPYRIPTLVLMTLRGWPDPADDEPQHAVMGRSGVRILEALDVPHSVLSHGGLDEALSAAADARVRRKPFFLLVPRGSVGSTPSAERPSSRKDRLNRATVVSAVLRVLTDELLVTTTGYLSRQAHHERDRAGTFYMQGSMGHAAAIGLGLATARPDRQVIVLDGDGAFLMHLGTGSVIGAAGPANLKHIVVDNGCYESTGCQRSTSSTVDWKAIGTGLGYRTVSTCETQDELDCCARSQATGPALCVVRVVPTPGEVHPRATKSTSPDQITDRFHSETTAGAATP